MEQRKNRTRSYFNGRTVTGTEFSYVIFTEQQNFTTAEWRNGNRRMATESWKPGITPVRPTPAKVNSGNCWFWCTHYFLQASCYQTNAVNSLMGFIS